MKQFTDQLIIKQVMHSFLQPRSSDSAPYIAAIHLKKGALWCDQIMKSKGIIGAVRPISAFTDANSEVSYSLSNMDSNYLNSIGVVKLSDIEFIQAL